MDRRGLLGFFGLTAAGIVVGGRTAAAQPGMPKPPPEAITPPDHGETEQEMPIGMIVAVAEVPGTQIMPNWMVCDGRELTRAHYHELFAVLGVAFGAGDGETTFAIPDMRRPTHGTHPHVVILDDIPPRTAVALGYIIRVL